MSYYAAPISKLIEELSKLPGVGNKTAQRLAFHVLNMPKENAAQLARAIMEAKERIRHCSICYNITDVDPCGICANAKRENSVICVVWTQGMRRHREDQRVQGEVPCTPWHHLPYGGHRPQ